MSDFTQGVLGSLAGGVEARNDVTVFVRNWFANLNPLVTRLPYEPVDRVDFSWFSHAYRAQSVTLASALATTTVTTMVVSDYTGLMNKDVLELVDSATGSTEQVQVNGDPTSATIVVTRGVAGTTAIAVTSASVAWNISNSRRGDEVDQTGLTTVGTSFVQYCQTFQFPVQIGGSAQTTGAAVLPGGIQSPLDFNRHMQLQNMINSIETAAIYGKKEAQVDAGTTAKMAGIKQILTTNNTTSPINLSAYGSTDLIRDTLEKARTGGGDPDLLLVSTNFMSGFSTWGHAVMRLSAGDTQFGTPINVIKAPFLGDVTIIEAPLLRPFTALALTSSEVYWRPKRNPFWQERGRRGDRVEGDWICEMGIAVVNQSHHAWLEGVTAFSAN